MFQSIGRAPVLAASLKLSSSIQRLWEKEKGSAADTYMVLHHKSSFI